MAGSFLTTYLMVIAAALLFALAALMALAFASRESVAEQQIWIKGAHARYALLELGIFALLLVGFLLAAAIAR